MQVSPTDAASFEKKMHEEVFEKWVENTDVIYCTRIPKDDIRNFVDHMQSVHKGNLKRLLNSYLDGRSLLKNNFTLSHIFL